MTVDRIVDSELQEARVLIETQSRLIESQRGKIAQLVHFTDRKIIEWRNATFAALSLFAIATTIAIMFGIQRERLSDEMVEVTAMINQYGVIISRDCVCRPQTGTEVNP